MITPQFKVTQDDEFVYIKIRAPSIKASAIEFFVENDLFIFSLHPYYLRLRFPGNVVDDEEKSKTEYDIGTSMISVRISKETAGMYFEDLDMTTKLLARLNEPSIKETNSKKRAFIQEIDDKPNQLGSNEIEHQDAEVYDWEIPQSLPRAFDEPDDMSLTKPKYGFDNIYSGVVNLSTMNGNDINDLPDPDETCSDDRTKLRIEFEDLKFDEDHYIADFMDDEEIKNMLNWSLPQDIYSEGFSEEENERLLRLPKKQYFLNDPRLAYLNLIQLLFGFCYDYRTTFGEHTIESAWTIGKLLPMFSCLETPNSVRDIMVICSRRALCYPLYRHWGLTLQIWKDVSEIVNKGRKTILKCLLYLNEVFTHEQYQVYNEIWIQDYCAWIQYANDNVIASLCHELNKVQLQKYDIGFNLLELEELGNSTLNEDGIES